MALISGTILLILDFSHSLIATSWLLNGSYRDGEGLIDVYPGQLKPPKRPDP